MTILAESMVAQLNVAHTGKYQTHVGSAVYGLFLWIWNLQFEKSFLANNVKTLGKLNSFNSSASFFNAAPNQLNQDQTNIKA